MANINPLTADNLLEDQLKKYVIQKDADLDKDYTDRVGGVANSIKTGMKIAGYTFLRNFFDGDHWSYMKDDGVQIRVYNYCRTTVLNYTSFLSNEPPEDDMPPRDQEDDLEVARAEEVERLLLEIKSDNSFPVVFAEAVQNQSLLGDCFIFGPYIEWQMVDGKKMPRIRFKNIKRVENVRPIWADEDFNEMEGFIFHYRISTNKAEKIYENQLKARGIPRITAAEPQRYPRETGHQMCTIKIYWDRKYLLAMANEQVIDFQKHDWGFVPGIFVKNMSHPVKPWGISDIEDMLDPQVEYNESVCATRGKINQVAVPHIFYSGEGEPVEYMAGEAQMIKLDENAKVWPDPMGQSTAPFENYTADRKQDIHHLSMISEIFYGGAMTAKATGRALSVLMQGVNNKVKHKQQYWKVALMELNANILRLVEIYAPSSKVLIQGYYKTDIFFPSILIRNVMEEINKFNMKLQSQYTTMKNIGIPSPKEEQKIMHKEWDDQSLAIEISRNPQFRMEVQRMMQANLTGRGEEGPTKGPTLTEGDGGAGHTADEEQPASAEGVPQQGGASPEGAIAQEAFRSQ